MDTPKKEDFEKALEELIVEAKNQGSENVYVSSGDLHRKVGGYPGSNHRMPICCGVMKKRKGVNDVIVNSPPSGIGASLEIRYKT